MAAALALVPGNPMALFCRAQAEAARGDQAAEADKAAAAEKAAAAAGGGGGGGGAGPLAFAVTVPEGVARLPRGRAAAQPARPGRHRSLQPARPSRWCAGGRAGRRPAVPGRDARRSDGGGDRAAGRRRRPAHHRPAAAQGRGQGGGGGGGRAAGGGGGGGGGVGRLQARGLPSCRGRVVARAGRARRGGGGSGRTGDDVIIAPRRVGSHLISAARRPGPGPRARAADQPVLRCAPAPMGLLGGRGEASLWPAEPLPAP